MDRRKLCLFQSAVKVVQAVVLTEIIETVQEHQASYDETSDDEVTLKARICSTRHKHVFFFFGQRNQGSDAVTVRMNEGKKNVLVAKGSTGTNKDTSQQMETGRVK